MLKTLLFKFEAPKQPMTRPYYWALIHRSEDSDKLITYLVCRVFTDGSQGNGFYTKNFNEALARLKEHIARDMNFYAKEWKRSLSELELTV